MFPASEEHVTRKGGEGEPQQLKGKKKVGGKKSNVKSRVSLKKIIKKKLPTAPGVPRRSPIQVLTGPDVA